MRTMRGWRRGLLVPAAIVGLMATSLGAASPALAQAAGSSLPVTPPSSGSWVPTTPSTWSTVVSEQSTPPVTVSSGITYGQTSYQTVGGPQRGSVLSVDLNNPNVGFRPVLTTGKLASDGNTVSSATTATGAVAGTNGDFFDGVGRIPLPAGQGQPTHLLIQNGQIVASGIPSDCGVVAYTNSHQLTIGRETFSGTVTDGSTSVPLAAINEVVWPDSSSQCDHAVGSPGLVLETPAWGTSGPLDSAAPVALLKDLGGGSYQVTSIEPSATTSPSLAGNEAALIGYGAGSSFVGNTLQAGQTIQVSDSVSPNPGIEQAAGGGFLAVINGAVNPEIAGDNASPEGVTAVGVSQDGTQVIVGVFDGQQASIGDGLGYNQIAGWLLQQGAYQGIIMDGGGSSDMTVRLPGQVNATVRNSPSDGQERDVAECLCWYSTEASAGAATSVNLNGGKPLTVLSGTTVDVPEVATDALGNPAAGTPAVSVIPPNAAKVVGTTTGAGGQPEVELQAEKPTSASGARLVIHDGAASASVPLEVVPGLASISLSPAEPDLGNGASQQFTLGATAPNGRPVTLPDDAATWSASPSDLGTVNAGGLFTAASTGSGLVTVTASAGGASATASVAVGETLTVVDPMTDVSNWSTNFLGGTSGSISLSTTQIAQPGDTGSMDVNYDIPAGSGVKQVVISPNTVTDQLTTVNGENPSAIGLWVKGGNGPTGMPLGPGVLTLAEAGQAADGTNVTIYPTDVDFNGWTLVEGQLPAGLSFPLTITFVDFLVINPATTMTGNLYVADLGGLYSPRPVPPPVYTAIPRNPSWLQYVGSPDDFEPGGTTIATFDDSHLQSADTNTTGSVITKQIGTELHQLPPQATPSVVQVSGNLTDDGTVADLQYGQSLLAGFNIPYHDAPGNHEIGQGTYPENGNFASVFGPTHYTYTVGSARVIVLDTAHIGITESDPYQVPAEEQWQWLIQQLTANTSPVTIIDTHSPAYDPQPIDNSQWTNRYEAMEYEALALRYQETHPQTHVLLLFGQARGVAEQVLNPEGQPVTSGGIPNLTIADAGVAAYAPVNQGGFYNYGLLHVESNGTVQFAIQPVLKSITINAPPTSLTPGQRVTLSATGTTPTGDDLAPLSVPIADPASHVWSSSDHAVASIDPDTGVLRAHGPGTATISVTSGGITATTTVTVTA